MNRINSNAGSGLGRPFDSPFCSHIQIVWPNKLEHGIVFDSPIPFSNKLVSVDQLGKEDLDFLQRKVETDAHSWSRGKGDVCGLMSVFHFWCIPPIWVEPAWVVPNGRIIMNMVQGRYHDCVFGQFVSARQNQVNLRSASGLERWIVSALSLLNIFVKKPQTISNFSSYLSILVNTVVNQLLKQSILHVGVGDEAVYKPGKQGAGCSEPSTSCNHQSPNETRLW